jgi:crotonobetainyl-CoA:carnitine CoA-transferase CaiB-like acyl-CoA transferase
MSDPSQEIGPLAGVRVLDLSRFIAGPLCGQMLGDFGADVIKVERPSGEDPRHHEPYYRGESLYTMLYNRNKRAITLDSRHPKALPILERLVEWADVVVENYRPGTIDKMGIGFERMRELNPDVILVSISGFGQTGPDSRRALFDAIAQATSGLMSITGEPDGKPVLTGTYIADYTTAYVATIGAFAAVMHKMRTGEGQRVDIASLDSMFSSLGIRLMTSLMTGEEMPRSGNRDLLTAPVNVYESQDDPVYIQAGTNSLFPRLCKVIDREELLADERFQTVPGRMAHQERLEKYVAEWALTAPADELVRQLDEAGIPCAKVASLPDVAASPQIAARNMVVEVEHPTLGPLRLPNSPIKMDRSGPQVRKAPPTVGEDTEEVFEDVLGLTPDQVSALRDQGVI